MGWGDADEGGKIINTVFYAVKKEGHLSLVA